MGEGVGADEDEGAGADFQGDERAVAGFEAAEDELDVGDGIPEPQEVADDRKAWRSRRQVSLLRRERSEKGGDEGGEAE